jgi:hypothetical protein
MSLQSFISTPCFEDYQELFKDIYRLSRRQDGVVLAEAHTKAVQYS